MYRPSLHNLLILVVAVLLSGCTGLYFRRAGQEPPSPIPIPLSDLSPSEYWSGVVFNGARIGFSHFRLSPYPEDRDLFDIYSEAFFRIRFLLMDKKIDLRSHDRVAADLSLVRFNYSIDLDDSHMTVSGMQNAGNLSVTVQNRSGEFRRTVPVATPVYPTSAIILYPRFKGLQVGRLYKYDVFDGQTQRVETVEQSVTAYEESELYQGPAFKIRTRFKGQTVTSWMDAQGLPLLEMSLGGVVISALESQADAQRYLSQAAFNKDEALLDFSLMKSAPLGQAPDTLQSVTVAISGLTDSFGIRDDERQSCRRNDAIVVCQVSKSSKLSPVGEKSVNGEPASFGRYLQPTLAISSAHPDIQQAASEIAAGLGGNRQRVHALVDWMQAHIRREAVDVFTAVDVLKDRRAECQGHAILFAALTRSLGIPTRVVNGMVYVPRFEGFLFHSWNESYIDGRWMAIDPIFNQFPADATHIKLVEGDNFSELLPLVEMIGKLGVDIISADRQRDP
jgi:hypothetical protein